MESAVCFPSDFAELKLRLCSFLGIMWRSSLRCLIYEFLNWGTTLARTTRRKRLKESSLSSSYCISTDPKWGVGSRKSSPFSILERLVLRRCRTSPCSAQPKGLEYSLLSQIAIIYTRMFYSQVINSNSEQCIEFGNKVYTKLSWLLYKLIRANVKQYMKAMYLLIELKI